MVALRILWWRNSKRLSVTVIPPKTRHNDFLVVSQIWTNENSAWGAGARIQVLWRATGSVSRAFNSRLSTHSEMITSHAVCGNEFASATVGTGHQSPYPNLGHTVHPARHK